jgi:xylulose-5-phosphate/fructose-6-phosphate phosphoketolase
LFVEGEEPEEMHRQMASAVEKAIDQIQTIQRSARENNDSTRPRWPVIILRSPKGWTGPKVVDGSAPRSLVHASRPPAEAPIPTTGKSSDPRGG